MLWLGTVLYTWTIVLNVDRLVTGDCIVTVDDVSFNVGCLVTGDDTFNLAYIANVDS